MSVPKEILNRPVAASDCPAKSAVAVIGGRWKSIILFYLVENALRFSELKRAIPNVSDRMLTRSLKELERDGLIQRAVFAEVPVRAEYSLTSSGKGLIPVLNAMSEWGQEHWNMK